MALKPNLSLEWIKSIINLKICIVSLGEIDEHSSHLFETNSLPLWKSLCG